MTAVSQNKEAEAFQGLLAWYDQSGRSLPWRQDREPYHVWVSEIMLQQTRVEAVKEYYRRFLAQLPDIASLAAAQEDTYLKLWEGLGYYSRVRNLHKAAEEAVRRYGGRLPGSAAELKKLPGIGEYTSAAIASISFGEKIPAVDGNLLRIYARLVCCADNIRTDTVRKKAFQYFTERMPEERPGDFNQALMDLGSMVCMPAAEPLCGNCPLAGICGAHAAGQEKMFPAAQEKTGRKIENRTVLIIRSGDRVMIGRRPEKGLLAGLWEFPNYDGYLSGKEAVREAEKLGVTVLRVKELPDAKHIFTHKEWHMKGYELLTADMGAAEADHSGRFLAAGRGEIEDKYPLPSAFAVYREIALR